MGDHTTYHDAHGIGRLRLREIDGLAQLRAHNELDEMAVHLTPAALERLARDAVAMARRLRRISIPVYDIPWREEPTT